MIQAISFGLIKTFRHKNNRPTHLKSFKRNLTSMKASKLLPTLMVHRLMVHRTDGSQT
jgi:hypothetical protein